MLGLMSGPLFCSPLLLLLLLEGVEEDVEGRCCCCLLARGEPILVSAEVRPATRDGLLMAEERASAGQQCVK